jgi:putative pyruvate formate lyase activating enzyme
MPDYWRVVTGCIERVYRAGKKVLVRHLLMPGHFDCCTRPALEWLAGRPGIEVSLLTQYVAPPQAKGELAGELQVGEITSARELARELGLILAR